MKLDDVITDINRSIRFQEQEIANLKDRKLKFQSIKEQYPDAHYESNSICLPRIWDKVTCMRIEQKRKYYRTSKINVKFLLGKKNAIEGMKIFTMPFENEIAIITHVYGAARSKEITVFDYKKIIPVECPKRNAFIKRIKLYLVSSIMEDNLIINDKSCYKEEFNKLMLLK